MEIEESLNAILDEVKVIKDTELTDICTACNKILAEDIIAPMMVPPFPKSAMDGYAAFSGDVCDASEDKPVILDVTGELLAGDYKELTYRKNTAIRVMTGSYIPEGYDCVIKQEDTDYGENEVRIFRGAKPYMNYCKVGEDIREGDIVAAKNTRITPLYAGLFASLGIEMVNVYRMPDVAVISTGTELTPLGSGLSCGKIYGSTAYILKAAIESRGMNVVSMEICEDNEDILTDKLNEAVSKADIVITTGAVSVGKKDIIPDVLKRLAARVLFNRVNIQPGTPTIGSMIDGKPVISLSGNPYAALANFELYFWPVIAKMLHNDYFDTVKKKAVFKGEYNKINRLRRLIRAYEENGEVRLVSGIHSSSVIHNLAGCNCFIDLRAGTKIKDGDTVYIRYMKGI